MGLLALAVRAPQAVRAVEVEEIHGANGRSCWISPWYGGQAATGTVTPTVSTTVIAVERP